MQIDIMGKDKRGESREGEEGVCREAGGKEGEVGRESRGRG